MANENTVQFNLKNVHYAVLTPGANGAPTYGTPVHVPGAVTLTLEPSGSMQPFYADGIIYYMGAVNGGYTGSLEMARYPDQMKQDIWGFTVDTNNILHENTTVEPNEFALMYQIDGDQDEELYCLYRCMGTKPGIGSTTNTDSKTPQTQTSNLTVAPIRAGALEGRVVSRTTANTSTATKEAWFNAVPVA